MTNYMTLGEDYEDLVFFEQGKTIDPKVVYFYLGSFTFICFLALLCLSLWRRYRKKKLLLTLKAGIP